MSQIIQKYLQTSFYGQEYYQTIEVEGLNTKFVSSSGVPKGLRFHIEYNKSMDTTYITVYGKIEQGAEEQYDFYFNFVDIIVKVTVTIDPSQVEETDYTSSLSFPNKFIHMWREFKNSMLDLEGSNIVSIIKESELSQAFYANNCINIDFNDVLKFDNTKTVRLAKANKKALSYVALSNPRAGMPTLMFWSYPDSDEYYFGVAKFIGDSEELETYNLFYKTSRGWLSTSYVSDIKVSNGNWYEFKQNVEIDAFPSDSYSPYAIEIFKNNDKEHIKLKLPLAPEPNEALYEDFNNLVSVFDKPRMIINNDIKYVEGDYNIDSTVYDLLIFDRPLELSIDGFAIRPVRDSAGNLKYGLIGLKVKDLNDSRNYDLALREYVVGRSEETPWGETITTLIPMILEYKHLDQTVHYIATLNGIKYQLDQVYGKTRDIYPEWMGDEWEPFIPLMAVKTDYINRIYGLLINNYQSYQYFYNRRFIVSKVAFDPYFDSVLTEQHRFFIDISNNTDHVTERNNRVDLDECVLTINPSPGLATVELVAPGYTQEGNSIVVRQGTTVRCVVSMEGYNTQVRMITVEETRAVTITLQKTMYTLIINPIPEEATVDLTAEGFEQVGNSITVLPGTEVTYAVSLHGYAPQSDVVVVDGNQTIPVRLSKVNFTLTIYPTPQDADVVLEAAGYLQEGNSITVPYETIVKMMVAKDGYIVRREITVLDNTDMYVDLSEDYNILDLGQVDEPVTSVIDLGLIEEQVTSTMDLGKIKN